MPKSRQLWSLMMYFFLSQDAKMTKMQMMPQWSKCQDAKKDAKMPRGQKMPVPIKKYQQYQDVKTRETKVTSKISHDAAFRNKRCKNYKKKKIM